MKTPAQLAFAWRGRRLDIEITVDGAPMKAEECREMLTMASAAMTDGFTLDSLVAEITGALADDASGEHAGLKRVK